MGVPTQKSDAPKFYVDGVLMPADVWTAGAGAWTPSFDNAMPVTLFGDSNHNFMPPSGTMIDDVRIYNRTLSSNEVVDLYAAAFVPVIPSNVSATDGAFTNKVRIAWSDVNGAASYQIFRHTSSNAASADQIGNSLSSTFDDVSAVVDTTYYYWVKATNSAGVSDFSSGDAGYRRAPGLASGLTAYYPLNGNANDESGNGHNGTANAGAISDTNGVLGGAYCFDGINGAIMIGNLGQQPQGTLSFWINAAAVENWRNPFTTDYASWDDCLRFEETGAREFYVALGPILALGRDYTHALQSNTWYHICFAWTTNQYVGWLDGQQVFGGIHTNHLYLNFNNVAIGNGYSTSSQRFWKGLVDDVRLYNRVLVSNEVVDLYALATLPATPSNIVASDGTYADKVNVSWIAVPGATAYEVWRNTTNDCGAALPLGQTTALSYDDTTVAGNTTNYFWVKAKNGSKASTFSASDVGWRLLATPTPTPTATATPCPPAPTITTNGGYIIHTFTTNGFFVVPSGTSMTCDVLVVAGGGGGGKSRGGGGGGGGVTYVAGTNVSGTNTIIVGAGGAKAMLGTTNAANGSNSVFGTLIAMGGGGGGSGQSGIGNNGGSGGGSANSSGGTGTQGHNGGAVWLVSNWFGSGGGGGAGTVGSNGYGSASSNQMFGGAGGCGIEYAQFSSVAGSPAGWFGGGGGGGSQDATARGGAISGVGGQGGGGAGGNGGNVGQDGLANTGGGGGGAENLLVEILGGNGGAGIVIVRYPVLSSSNTPTPTPTATSTLVPTATATPIPPTPTPTLTQTPVPTATPTPTSTVTIPLGVALNATNWTWSTGSQGASNGWFGQSGTSHDGVASAQSGEIVDSQSTWLQTVVTGPGTLRFWWKASTETNFDVLWFYVDGQEQSSLSGETDWLQQQITLASGVHTVQWAYIKDAGVSGGLNAGWVDEVSFVNRTPPSAPTNVAASDGTYTNKVNISWPATADATGYEVWRANVNEAAQAIRWGLINDGNTLNYDDTLAQENVMYWYWVKATNDLGTSALSIGDAGYRLPSRPIVTAHIVSPSNGTSFTTPATIPIHAELSVVGGQMTLARLYANATLLMTASNLASTAAMDYTWTHVSVGTYNLTLQVTDNLGGSSTSTPITVTVPAGEGTVRGQVTDAVNGWPLPGVTVSIGNRTAVTDTNGNYLVTGVAPGALNAAFDADTLSGDAPFTAQFMDQSTQGSATLQAARTNYISYRNERVEVTPGGTNELCFSMSPIMVDVGQMRFVLNWGANPRDLDSHLVTPMINGQSYHIAYYNRGSLSNPPYVFLDVDDVSSYGPETTTLGRYTNGTYTYYVHHYAGSSALSNSAATVKIYTSQGLIRTINCPTNGSGRYWLVGTLDGATKRFTVINTLSATVPETHSSQGMGARQADVLPPKPYAPRTDRRQNEATGAMAYRWDFGDGTISTESNPIKTFTDTGLYTVRLLVTLTNGLSDVETKTDFISVGQTAPSAPAGVLASDGTYPDRVRITWNNTDRAQSYTVYRSTANETNSLTAIETVTGEGYDDFTVTQGVTYYYWVKAANTAGSSDYSVSDSGYALLPIPAAPVITATKGSMSVVRVSWSAVAYATSYTAYRNTENNLLTASALGSVTTASYDDSTPALGVAYYYWVKAVNASGTSAFSAVDTGYRQLPAPGNVTATTNLTDKVKVTWSPVTGLTPSALMFGTAASYEVWRGTAVSGSGMEKQGTTTATLYEDETAMAGAEYYYWVRTLYGSLVGGYSSPAMGKRRRTSDTRGTGVGNLAVYREANGVWTVMVGSSNFMTRTVTLGGTGYAPIPADYDGDGTTDYAVYHEASGAWFVMLSASGNQAVSTILGGPGFMAVPADYDGDNQSDPAVYSRETGNWIVLLSSANYSEATLPAFGGNGYWPVPGDYDGDNRSDPGIYSDAFSVWAVMLSAQAYLRVSAVFGGSDLIPVPADYDGDGRMDPAVYSESTGVWYVMRSGSGYALSTATMGGPGFEPLPGDVDGDGKADYLVYQETSGMWMLMLSASNYAPARAFLGGPGYLGVGVMR